MSHEQRIEVALFELEELRQRAEAAEAEVEALRAAIAVECTCLAACLRGGRIIETCERCEAIDAILTPRQGEDR